MNHITAKNCLKVTACAALATTATAVVAIAVATLAATPRFPIPGTGSLALERTTSAPTAGLHG